MKRFITYLYEYHDGKKEKNIGFIRVNIRGQKTDMQICIRNCLREEERGNVFVLINTKKLLGVELGEIKIRKGECDESISVSTDNIMEQGFSVSEIAGVGIRLQEGAYFASCWKDEYTDEIARGEFCLQLDSWEREEVLPLKVAEEEIQQESSRYLEQELTQNNINSNETITFEKINLDQIRDLPSPNWHLSTNSFLVHGFWNYGYLVLKKEIKADQETLSLGVPGIFEKPEAVMAILFGFPEFEEIPSGMAEVERNVEKSFPYIEKNQEAEVGTFGCWFVDLKK